MRMHMCECVYHACICLCIYVNNDNDDVDDDGGGDDDDDVDDDDGGDDDDDENNNRLFKKKNFGFIMVKWNSIKWSLVYCAYLE